MAPISQEMRFQLFHILMAATECRFQVLFVKPTLFCHI